MKSAGWWWLVAALFCGEAIAQSSPSGFDFRGASLGMSQEEFMALPMLGDRPPACGNAALPAYTAIGARSCYRPGDQPFPRAIVSYEFLPTDDGLRLAHIFVLGSTADAYTASNGLRERWGEPTRSEPVSLQNAYGATFNGTRDSWVKGDQVVTLENPCSRRDRICISYIETKLMAAGEERVRAIPGAGQKF
jgi:hypothetical protein